MTRRKKQPTAEVMREQLALAADEIIRLRDEGQEPDRNDLASVFAVGFTAGFMFTTSIFMFCAWWFR